MDEYHEDSQDLMFKQFMKEYERTKSVRIFLTIYMF